MSEKLKYKMAFQIFSKLLRGVYKEGNKLPSMNQLAKNEETSRETIRSAVGLLIRKGIILRLNGTTFVFTDNIEQILLVRDQYVKESKLEFKNEMEQLKYRVEENTDDDKTQYIIVDAL